MRNVPHATRRTGNLASMAPGVDGGEFRGDDARESRRPRDEGQERVRRFLDFAESSDSADVSDRFTSRHVPGSSTGPDSLRSGDDVVRRLDRLAGRVEALGALVESLFDRVEQSVSATAPLTSEEMADVAARMVRLIEARLESHSERLEHAVTALSQDVDRRDAANPNTVPLEVVDDHLSMIGRALIDMKKSMHELERAPETAQEQLR